ncbi:MAG: hypothetical protein Q7T25_09440 [Sideroxyarcus sp.]|nr:hypothetical protein [Sideroxyarcus sp.]
MTQNLLSPELKKLLKEFLKDAVDQKQNDETKARWTKRDDLAVAFHPYVENLPTIDANLSDAMAIFAPEARFWQLALFRVCGRRAVKRLEKDEEQKGFDQMLKDTKTFGMF